MLLIKDQDDVYIQLSTIAPELSDVPDEYIFIDKFIEKAKDSLRYKLDLSITTEDYKLTFDETSCYYIKLDVRPVKTIVIDSTNKYKFIHQVISEVNDRLEEIKKALMQQYEGTNDIIQEIEDAANEVKETKLNRIEADEDKAEAFLRDNIKEIMELLYRVDDMELGNMIYGNSRGKYSLNIYRDELQDIFVRWLADNNFDEYGADMSKGQRSTDRYGKYENDVFSIQPYYWGDEEEICSRPNFIYKPEDIQISWYKYPMRDAYSNVQLTPQKLEGILRKIHVD